MMSLRVVTDEICDTQFLDVEAYLRELGAGSVSAGDVAQSKTDVGLYYALPTMTGSRSGTATGTGATEEKKDGSYNGREHEWYVSDG